jgi:NAD(P) transhydrogenase subunit beta
MTPDWVSYLYLLSISLFILGIIFLNSVKTARRGNFLGAVGMLIAIVVTLVDLDIADFEAIVIGLTVGTIIGALMAQTVKMTAMPQMVALFNGFGGGASALVALAELIRLDDLPGDPETRVLFAIGLGAFIGAVTFAGSMVAFGKLQELINTRPARYPFQQSINLVLFLGIMVAMFWLVFSASEVSLLFVVLAASLVLGVLLVIRIGGGDMPVVISLLNSYSGLAAVAAGFAVGNSILITAGALVGAAGIILTYHMCRAMNRSIINVAFGEFGRVQVGPATAELAHKAVTETTPEEAALLLAYANTVVFVPGYGLAVAQAQHQVRELADLLEAKGVDVKYGIHPVAGRMPGHMNVLLAEANVPYDKLYDMDQINDEFPRTDVAVVVGANDVVNPAARYQQGSPIYGMPILNVDKAKSVIVLKRSMNPGFAGIENELFYNDNTRMLFGDAKASLTKLVTEVKAL